MLIRNRHRSFAVISAAILIFVHGSKACASPCDGVDRRLSRESKIDLASAIAKQLKAQLRDVSKVKLLQSFRFSGWSIVYVETHVSDEGFLFYAGDPQSNHYVTLWAGAATIFEEHEVEGWTLKNAPGIPPRLATCFAWHVTHDRDE